MTLINKLLLLNRQLDWNTVAIIEELESSPKYVIED